MQAVDLIGKKRDGGVLSTGEIDWFIEQYTRESIPDYQMSALLMAIYWRGLDERETSDLTLAMARSGEQLQARVVISPVVDKHSTGGVGDKVTLAVAPLVAACGVAVGKMSGRGLGHTGGTIDKLEAIRGLRVDLSRDEFLRVLTQHHLVLSGQSGTLAPADGKIYALRDVTGTVDSIPLIASSIMSKKLAIGPSHLLLDVKFGSGAFMQSLERARELASIMVKIGTIGGIHTIAAITSMEQPLGRAVGNALEVAEAIAVLRGEGSADISQLCYHEAAELLLATRAARDMGEAEALVTRAVRSGAALAKLEEMVVAQGGDGRQVEQPALLPCAPVRVMLAAPDSGYIASIDAKRTGLVSMRLGAGRFKKGDPIDHSTGLVLQAKVGDYCQVGDPLVEIHARSMAEVASVQQELLSCYTWSEAPAQPGPLICNVIYP